MQPASCTFHTMNYKLVLSTSSKCGSVPFDPNKPFVESKIFTMVTIRPDYNAM